MSCTHLICSLYCTCLLSLSLSCSFYSLPFLPLFCVPCYYIQQTLCAYLKSPLFLMSRLLFVCLSVAVIIPCFFLSSLFLKGLCIHMCAYMHGTLRTFLSFIIFIVCIRGLITDFKCAYKDLLCECVWVRMAICEPNRFHSDNIMNVTVIWNLPWSLIHYRMWI